MRWPCLKEGETMDVWKRTVIVEHWEWSLELRGGLSVKAGVTGTEHITSERGERVEAVPLPLPAPTEKQRVNQGSFSYSSNFSPTGLSFCSQDVNFLDFENFNYTH